MDIEKFRNAWWSSAESTVSIQLEEAIDQSIKKPDSYWPSLQELQNQISRKSAKSLAGQNYDFYYDLVLRHEASTNAIISIDKEGKSHFCTYQQLHRYVNFQIKEWAKLEVSEGQIVILMMPVGIPFIVALLTALRMGLVFCFLPPQSRFLGKNYLASLIEEIEPHFIVTQSSESLLSQTSYPHILVNENLGLDESEPSPISFSYSPDTIMQLSLALYRQVPLAMVPLDAHTTYLHSLRDGLVTFNLKPGIIYSSLHECAIRTQPCSTLATFLSGATLLHVSDEALTDDCTFLSKEKIHILELPHEQYQSWTKGPGAPIKHLKGYYRSPLYYPVKNLQAFAASNKIPEIPTFQCLLDNSLGGASLVSKPTTQDLSLFLKPSCGISFYLAKPDLRDEVSLEGFGIFQPQTFCQENDLISSNLILSQIKNDYIISGTQSPCREGVTIPRAAIESCVAKLAFVQSVFLHTIPKIGEVAHHQLILLVFVDPIKVEDLSDSLQEKWSKSIHQKIQDDVGLAFVPDLIDYFSLVPKTANSLPDRRWCIEQYLSGRLKRKKTALLYKTLSRLKNILSLQ